MFNCIPKMMNIYKPFNPILGETIQGHYSGLPFYMECISHRPPIFALLQYGDGYRNDAILHPDMEFTANINEFSSSDRGQNRLFFKNTG